jgi:hypothetical protein
VIVIVASRYDMPARRLCERWAGHGGCLLTSEDLSVCGWRYYPKNADQFTAILGGHHISQPEIRGVVTRLSWIWEGELRDIVGGDRAYVAAEMSAFLLCWLSGLTCPVLNRPTASCLNGPGWGREQWAAAARKAGMRVEPFRRRAGLALSADEPHQPVTVMVTVVGERCLGQVDEALLLQARRLAAVAGTDLLGVQFSASEADARFVAATTCPDLLECGADDAILARLGITVT